MNESRSTFCVSTLTSRELPCGAADTQALVGSAPGGRGSLCRTTLDALTVCIDTVGWSDCRALHTPVAAQALSHTFPSLRSVCVPRWHLWTWADKTVPALDRTRSTRETVTLRALALLRTHSGAFGRTPSVACDSVHGLAAGRVRGARSLYMQCACMPLLAACPHPACRPTSPRRHPSSRRPRSAHRTAHPALAACSRGCRRREPPPHSSSEDESEEDSCFFFFFFLELDVSFLSFLSFSFFDFLADPDDDDGAP